MNEIEKVFSTLEKEMRTDDGTFVLQLGKKRNFSSVFTNVSNSNYILLKELYKKALEYSLNGYVKNHFTRVDRSIIQVVKYFDNVVAFVFGDENHKGVYPLMLSSYYEKFQQAPSVLELIPAAESLFVQGYSIRDVNGEYYLLNPSLGLETMLERQEGKSSIRSYDYMVALKQLLRVKEGESINDTKKMALTSFEVIAEAEREVFSVASDYNNSLMTLTDINSIGSFGLHAAKVSDRHSSCVLVSGNKYLINVSHIGKKFRNYFWLVADYAEHRMLDDLTADWGFVFIKNPPVKYVIDHQGYLVSKMLLTSSDIVFSNFNMYPSSLASAMEMESELSSDTRKYIESELSTYLLLQMSLGSDVLDKNSFLIDRELRVIYNNHHSDTSTINKYSYPSTPNNTIKLDIDRSMSAYMEYRELRMALEDFYRDKRLPLSYNKFFGIQEGISMTRGGTLIENADNCSIAKIPADIFTKEKGVFSDIGEQIYHKQVSIYDNWFAEHLKSSGLPEYTQPFLILCNRFALFALMSAQENGRI